MRTQMIWVPMVCLTMASGVAAAQSVADRAGAEQLFQEGRALMKQGDFLAACPKLEASFALDPALGTQLNLAACYEHIDRPASAWVHYRAVVDRAQQAGQASRVEMARRRAAVVEPRVPRLVVRVPAAARVPGLVVTRDDTALAPALFDTPLYVDAGEHHVRATAPGREPFVLTVRVAAGEERVVEIRLPAPAPAPALAPAAAAEPAPGTAAEPTAQLRLSPPPPVLEAQPIAPAGAGGAPGPLAGPEADPRANDLPARTPGLSSSEAVPPPGGSRRTLAWVTGGTGVAGVALGLGLGWTAVRAADQLFDDGRCDRQARVCIDEAALGRLEGARIRARAASVVVGGSIALMAAGGILYWTARDRGDDRSARVVPTAGATGLGLAVTGRF